VTERVGCHGEPQISVGSRPCCMDRLGGALGSIAKKTIPFRERDSVVPAGQGCAAVRYPRATVRLCGPTWESPTSSVTPPDPVVPFKANADHRRHNPKQRHRVTNWRDYHAALRRRGSLTVWFTDEAIVGWRAQRRTTPGGQPHYSPLAIETALTLRAVFRLPLSQTEGLISSII
jgi:hypothetical protein